MSTKITGYVYTTKFGSDNNCVCDCIEDRHMVVHPIGVCTTNGNPSLYEMCWCDHCACWCHN